MFRVDNTVPYLLCFLDSWWANEGELRFLNIAPSTALSIYDVISYRTESTDS